MIDKANVVIRRGGDPHNRIKVLFIHRTFLSLKIFCSNLAVHYYLLLKEAVSEFLSSV